MKKIIISIIFIGLAVVGGIVGFSLAPKLDPKHPLYHYSFWATKAFFTAAWQQAQPIDPYQGNPIVGLVVNHHLLAPHFIARTLAIASDQKPSVILLLSPNHFQIGKKQILTSAHDWMTPYGAIKTDKKLSTALGLFADEVPWEQEHGIKNIMPFIKHYFPATPVIPVIVKYTTSDATIDQLARTLAQELPERALIIASFDFSHDQTSDVADANDSRSITVLQTLDYAQTKNLDIDSKPGLRLFLEILSLRGAKTFSLVDHSNAAKLARKPEMENVTSYITGYFSQ